MTPLPVGTTRRCNRHSSDGQRTPGALVETIWPIIRNQLTPSPVAKPVRRQLFNALASSYVCRAAGDKSHPTSRKSPSKQTSDCCFFAPLRQRSDGPIFENARRRLAWRASCSRPMWPSAWPAASVAAGVVGGLLRSATRIVRNPMTPFQAKTPWCTARQYSAAR